MAAKYLLTDRKTIDTKIFAITLPNLQEYFTTEDYKMSTPIRSIPLAQTTDMFGAPATGITDNAYQRAKQVFDKLVEARGDYRYPAPDFVLLDREESVAFMNYDLLQVQLEQKAYKVCEAFGDPALAFLLGHELTHYYEKHGWRRGFASEYSDLPIGIQIKGMLDKVANETEADYLGGFLAYSAGYGIFDKGAELMQQLYEAYNMRDENVMANGYPSLADRQEISRRTKQKLEELVEVFELANLLNAIGSFDEAYEYYLYVVMRYQSREIYNNMGVARALRALGLFDESEIIYHYPIQLDLQSTGGSRSMEGEPDRNELLRQALVHFDAAISLDSGYAPAYLNKACVLALLGDPVRARFYAEVEARSRALENAKYAKTAVDADILIGILEAKSGNTAAAKKLFETAATTNKSPLAAVNLKILNGDTWEPERTEITGAFDEEAIDGLEFIFVAYPTDSDGPAYDPDRSIELTNGRAFHQNPAPGPNSKIYMSKGTGDNPVLTIFQLTTNAAYEGKTARGIALGDDRAKIVSAYGEPRRTVETPMGDIMVYKKLKIIFIISGQDKKLVRWINYTTR